MHSALPRYSAHVTAAESSLTGILAHLDAVYGFSLTLTGDPDRAGELTEGAFASVRDDLWSTLGGHGLRERLLAQCVRAYANAVAARKPGWVTTERSGASSERLRDVILELPWDERAAVALVDQLGLTRTDAAAVLGTTAVDFRSLLHRGRAVLFARYRAGAR